MGSLTTFIRAVRSSKTIADERACIRKESAKIRSSFRDPHLDESHRRKNIEKLLYLYILGEPTYFGQVECLKLLVSPTFTNKRLGYMSAMLLLDENQEILTLLTNSLDNDLKNSSQYITGLALCTLGNVCSPELAKDLYANVEELLNTPSPYLRKKAAIVAAKLVKKEPDLCEVFVEKVPALLREKHHGVLLGALHLTKEIYLNDETSHQMLKDMVPRILAHLRFLVGSGYSPEYDVKGMPDPFLYISLLQTLRLLLQDDPGNPNLEAMNDLLTQICARLENAKGPSHAVLYEAVQTIFAIESDSSLRVLGVNILSKFLTLKNNNTRYVALNTLLSVMNYEPLAVQRHRAMIIGCLQDGDVSIRRRALELTFAIMNPQNIRMLTKELLSFLSTSTDDDLQLYITTQLTLACYKYSPGIEWTFDTVVKLLQIAGNHFSDDIISSILALIMQNNNTALTQKLLGQLIEAAKTGYDQFALALVTTWCLGEYGELAGATEEAEVDLLETFLNVSSLDDDGLRHTQLQIYALTAALKLSVRFKTRSQVQRLRTLIESYQSNTDLEIQMRAIEYTEIFNQPKSVKNGLLEKMPPPPAKEHAGVALFGKSVPVQKTAAKPEKAGNLLLDLVGEPGEDAPKAEALDILSDIFGSTSLDTKTAAKPAQPVSNANADILNLFGSKAAETAPTPVSVAPPVSVPPPKFPAFNDNVISVGFTPQKVGGGEAVLSVVVKNESSESVGDISVLCAVTKSQKLQLSSLSNSRLGAGQSATLNATIQGKTGSKVRLRVKLGYTYQGQNVQKQFDFGSITERL